VYFVVRYVAPYRAVESAQAWENNAYPSMAEVSEG
jgi:hypothetical protein